MPKRAAVAFFFDERGIVDDYIPFLLSEIRKFVERIVFVSNGPRRPKLPSSNAPTSFSFGRTKGSTSALSRRPGANRLRRAEPIRRDLCSTTCYYGPVFPFDEMFQAMDARECDFWGITAHKTLEFNPFGGEGGCLTT